MAAPVPLHADRGNGRTYTTPARRRAGQTSTHGCLTNGHLKLHPDLHHLDGRDPNFGADPPEQRGRPMLPGKRARYAAGGPTGVMGAARTEHGQCATREVCRRGKGEEPNPRTNPRGPASAASDGGWLRT